MLTETPTAETPAAQSQNSRSIRFRAPIRVRDAHLVSAPTVLLIGGISAFGVSAFYYVLRLLTVTNFSPEFWLGRILIGRTDAFGWNFGFSALIFEGAVFALLYASLFRSAHRSGVRIGLHLSFIHASLVGLALSATQVGFFAIETGVRNSALLVIAHAIYGMTLGALFDLAAIRKERAVPITEMPDQTFTEKAVRWPQ